MAARQPTERETDIQLLDEAVSQPAPASIHNPNTTRPRRRVCALYMRVSTKGHGQTTDTQAIALREYAERRGFEVTEYRDEGISGAKDSRRHSIDS